MAHYLMAGVGSNNGNDQTSSPSQAIDLVGRKSRHIIVTGIRRLGQCLWYDLMGCRHSSLAVDEDCNYELVLASPTPEPIPIDDNDGNSLSNKIALGCGCYWGTEKFIKKDFQARFPGAIRKATVGFMSPNPDPPIRNPTYAQVCSSGSNTPQQYHVEVLMIELTHPHKHLEALLRFFFSIHDPTQRNRQGADWGFQYSSWIFCGDDQQDKIAQRVQRDLQAAMDARKITCFANRKIQTQRSRLHHFTKSPSSHQQYLLSINPGGYCNHRIRFTDWYTLQQVDKDKNDNAKDKLLEGGGEDVIAVTPVDYAGDVVDEKEEKIDQNKG